MVEWALIQEILARLEALEAKVLPKPVESAPSVSSPADVTSQPAGSSADNVPVVFFERLDAPESGRPVSAMTPPDARGYN